MRAIPLHVLATSLLTSITLTADLSAQLTLTVPAGMATAAGGTANNFPFGYTGTAWPGLRTQACYDSSHFTSQGVNQPILIQGISWRANDTTASWTGGTHPNATITMSSAAVDYSAVTTNFATNHGADLTTVYTGPVTVTPGTGNGAGVPSPFYINVPLSGAGFLYDPTSGNDLIIDCDNVLGGWTGGTTTSHDVDNSATALASRVYASSMYPNANGTTQNHGIVIEVSYVPAQGLYANFSANVQSGNSPLTVNFTDTSFTSQTGGVTSWAWDFENDGTVDSTAQNPTHIYTACGEFDVSLTVTDGQNPASTEVKTAFISVDPLAADFTATPTFGAEPLIVNFTDTSTGGSAVPIMWEWDMDGDGVFDIMGTTPAEQNPVWVYLGGTYSVTLRTTFACTSGVGVVSETKTDLITCVGATSNTASADLFEFQFNEVRYDTAYNSASTTAAAQTASVSPSGWQVDAGRAGFKGDGANGALGNSGLVSTAHALDQNGSMTICWWQRLNSATGTSLAYAFGGSGGNFRCFTGGVAGNTLWYRGSSIGDVQASYDVQLNTGVWEHVALVVDDATGTADWYFNGILDTSTAFPVGTHTATNSDYHVGYHTSTASIYTDHYDLDDYRHYNNALSAAEIAALAAGAENPTSNVYGSGCAGSAGTPSISANEPPDGANPIGTPTYAISLSGAEANAGCFLAFGFQGGSNPLLPFDLGPVLGAGYAGCTIETDAASAVFQFASASGEATQALPIPGNGAFVDQHIYVQWLVLDSTMGAVSPALDVNIQ